MLGWRGSLFLALLVGCAPSATQLIVVVDTDLRIPMELDEIRLTVTGPSGTMETETSRPITAAMLPMTVAVIPDADELGPIEVVAEGRLGGTFVLDRSATTSLVRGESRVLTLHLLANCEGVDCGSASLSCGEDGCAPRDVVDLPPWTGRPPRLDAGVDAPAFDAGPRPDVPGLDAPDAGTPDAGPPCDADSDCDDGIDCTTGRCVATGCQYTPDDALCSDGNDCTDDRCVVGTGCMPMPNTSACNDSVFCNGFDTCSGGTCSGHVGNPCSGSTVCDESGDRCTGCTVDMDCRALDSVGSYGACDYADGCDEGATRSRIVRTFSCSAGACVPSDTTETMPCTRDTDGTSCGVGSCGGFGGCDYADGCDESAVATRTCTDLSCVAGTCRSSNRNETMPCSRDTDGTMCAATSCGGYGACDYADGCDEGANQSRTCNDFRCVTGTCGSTSRTETQACSRDTDGTSCGATSCGGYGACDYSSVCDESASQSRTCNDPVCMAGSCGSTMRTESTGCSRSTSGMSCGAGQVCSASMCIACTPGLSGSFGSLGVSDFIRVDGSGSSLIFNDYGGTSGAITASGVTFSGSVATPIALWQLHGMGNAIRLVDWDGATMGIISVSGATVSGSWAPPCVPSKYGCFPPYVQRVVGVPGGLQIFDSQGGVGTITFGCP